MAVRKTEYQPHPAADLFPPMDEETLAALAEDIRAHGLKEPIILHEGKILDGRSRVRACALAGIKPVFEEWIPGGESAAEFVVSMNLHRRHLTVGQRTALALDLLPHLKEEARERQSEGGKAAGRGRPQQVPPETSEPIAQGEAAAKAALIVGVGRTVVQTAKRVAAKDPDGEARSACRRESACARAGHMVAGEDPC